MNYKNSTAWKKSYEWIKRVIDAIEKKNFYVMIVLCIGILIFSGLFVTSRNIISSIGYENEEVLNYPNEAVNEAILEENSEYSKNVSSSNIDNEFIDKFSEKIQNDSKKEDVKGTGNSDKQVKGVESNDSRVSVPKMGDGSKLNEVNQRTKDIKTGSVKNGVSGNKTNKVEGKSSSKVSSSNLLNQKFSQVSNLNVDKFYLEAPVKGKISYDYYSDKLSYSKTLNEWRTHEGIDIKEEPGTSVKAARDGVVKEVKNDPRYGYTIVIDHENGYRTVYAALVKSCTIVPNQKIKSGEILGMIGNTAPFEALEPAHLHFEVLKDGKNQDPKMYLPQLGE
jgi:murein DD-endopeptidase MepM/ murein hydrolase activator NlpD